MAKKRKKPTKKVEETKYVWAIAYINRDFIKRVEEELKRYKYDIETYIPTVRVIKKKFKGENMFEFVPLFFNYGFFKIPLTEACNPEYLMALRSRITCIHGWVKDPALTVKDGRLRSNNIESDKAIPAAALASDKEIAEIIKTTAHCNIYSSEELERFKKGDYIQLKGYPFDDMPAKIIQINHKKKDIKVELLLENLITKEVTVSFENVFYTVYQGHDDSLSNDLNLDDIEHKKLGNTDKLMFNQEYYEKG